MREPDSFKTREWKDFTIKQVFWHFDGFSLDAVGVVEPDIPRKDHALYVHAGEDSWEAWIGEGDPYGYLTTIQLGSLVDAVEANGIEGYRSWQRLDS